MALPDQNKWLSLFWSGMTLVRDEKSLSGTVRYKYMMLILRTYNGASRRRNLPIKP